MGDEETRTPEVNLPLAEQSVQTFLDQVGARTPTPGGGAVAAVTAALATALGRMVLNFSIGRKNLEEFEPRHREGLDHLTRASSDALAAADRDAAAYARLNALWKLSEDDPRRRDAWDDAVGEAIAAPRAVLQLALDLLRELRELTGTTNPLLASDLAMAAILADAAARAAAWNVRINIPLADPRLRGELSQALERDLQSSATMCREIEAACV